MVEFVDHSVIAQMSLPSMKHPIQYAFTYPDRLVSKDQSVDFAALKNLSFFEPDEETFVCLALAKEAGRQGGIMPTVLNAANEVAVEAFLKDKIGFLDIADIVQKTMAAFKNQNDPDIYTLLDTDKEAREKAAEFI